MPLWHTQSTAAAAEKLTTDPEHGLTEAEASARLEQHGRNELIGQEGRNPWRIIWEQFTATMVLILIVAAIASAFLDKWMEASAILTIVLLFGLLGFIQEVRAEKAMAALKKLSVPNVRVHRDNQVTTVAATELVPGDVVLLEVGNFVPADLRLLESVNLRILESALTGESEAVEKQVEALRQADLPLGDHSNMTYMGTSVVYGRGSGLVVQTGMQTELGKIAGLLQEGERAMTPLQRRLDQVGKWLAAGGILTAVIVGFIEYLQGHSLGDVFLTGVSIAVAVVPEGLPAVVTVTLALGARRMLARNALIRRLPAVETLGSVTVICSDKTGTLTENRMTVTVVNVDGHRIDIDGQMTHRGRVKFSTDEISDGVPDAMRLLLVGGALCNDAELTAVNSEKSSHFHAIGDPTEGALVVAAARHGLHKTDLDKAMPRLAELPFDSERKRMTTTHQTSDLLPLAVNPGESISFTKGSVDGLLEITTAVWQNDEAVPLTPALRKGIEDANRNLAQNGMRVLGIAYRRHATNTEPEERDLVFVGMAGILDPPRSEVKLAIAQCHTAGIRPIMITGDHPLTALHIAQELGIAKADSIVITGMELETMQPDELDVQVNTVSVFARVAPEHKLRIVKALQRQGHVVAMTGDGVNDAPALKHANIGVAMGITGTDVSKEAAEMVLQDDNFATIVAAVEEGRTIFNNLRKFIAFSIGGNIGKIGLMIGGVMAGMPTPLLPLQLLWLNLMTDGLLGLGLGVEPSERNVMRRAPFSPKAGVFSDGLGGGVIRMGVVIAAVGLGVGLFQYWASDPNWQTMAFTTLAFAQVWQILGIRSGNDPLWKVSVFSNKPLLGLISLVVILQITAIYLPWLQVFLHTEALGWQDLLLCIGASSLVLLWAEIEKMRARSKLPPIEESTDQKPPAVV